MSVARQAIEDDEWTEEFHDWIDDLRERVIEGEYGYEPGEFSVFHDAWQPLFEEGLTPDQAWRRALDAFADARREEEADRKAKWERIQREDAANRGEHDH